MQPMMAGRNYFLHFKKTVQKNIFRVLNFLGDLVEAADQQKVDKLAVQNFVVQEFDSLMVEKPVG